MTDRDLEMLEPLLNVGHVYLGVTERDAIRSLLERLEAAEAEPDVMNAIVREERIVELEDENEQLKAALNETNERWERACSDLEAKVERLRTLQKHEADVYRKKVEENERLRAALAQSCADARPDMQACPEVYKLESRIEAALALHTEWGIFDECGHDHTQEDLDAGRCLDIPEVGLTCEEGKVQSVCRECHTDDGEPSEDTFEGEWPCPTHKALTGEGE